MREPRTIKQLVGRLRRMRPQTRDDLSRLGLEVKEIGGGCFRDVYELRGYSVYAVIKVPTHDDRRSGILHARKEIRTWRKIRRTRRLSILRRYLPVVHYADYKNGVVLMPYYWKRDGSKEFENGRDEVLERVFGDALGSRYKDFIGDNFRVDGRSRLRAIDLGIS